MPSPAIVQFGHCKDSPVGVVDEIGIVVDIGIDLVKALKKGKCFRKQKFKNFHIFLKLILNDQIFRQFFVKFTKNFAIFENFYAHS